MVELRAYTSAYGAGLAHGIGSSPVRGTKQRKDMPRWWNGIHAAMRVLCRLRLAGSSPVRGTKLMSLSSSGQGRKILSLVTSVRIRLGIPKQIIASWCSGSTRIENDSDQNLYCKTQFHYKDETRCSIPGDATKQNYGKLAEWLRQRFAKPSFRNGRIGSNPILSAKIKRAHSSVGRADGWQLSGREFKSHCGPPIFLLHET